MSSSGHSVQEISTYHVSGYMNSAERNKRINRLKNPGKEERPIRKSENKTFGTIVIPVYLSEISLNINDQVLASKFSGVWKIVLALKSKDDSLMEAIDSLRVSLGKKRLEDLIKKISRKYLLISLKKFQSAS